MKWQSGTQCVSWFKDRAVEGSLSLAEPYQRRPVWRLKEKCYLIESILMGCPIPEIYVHTSTTPSGETSYSVVDGQQRIRAILQFLGLDDQPEHDNAFSLTRLQRTSAWYEMSFNDLDDGVKQGFYEYGLSVRYLMTRDEREVRDMFMRLNRFSVPLKAQELRNAMYTGPFVRMSTTLADDSYFAKQGIVTPWMIRRMGDIELVSELLLGVIYGPQDGSPNAINRFYDSFEQYEDAIPDEAKTREQFEQVLGIVRRIFPKLGATRWSNKHDFYSLFVALAHYVRESYRFTGSVRSLRDVLLKFAGKVKSHIQNERARVPTSAVRYARAVQKGPSSKTRRGVRHQVLLKLLGRYFTEG